MTTAAAGRRPRLDQLLASLGYGSRSEVAEAVRAGRVSVGGVRARDRGQHVDPASVTIDGAPLDHPDGLYLVLHKPLGRVVSHDPREGPNVFGLLPARWRARHPAPAAVGRLDKDSSGLLLLTDDTPLVHRLVSPRAEVPKVYQVRLSRPPPAETAAAFAAGTLRLEGEAEPCAPAQLAPSASDPEAWEVTLTEGRHRQVRRMFAHFGCEVLALVRLRLGPIVLGDLAPGAWRESSRAEFLAAAGESGPAP